MNIPAVAIVGRPNVGKSALFNRIVGGNAAIVSDEEGTTRDRHFGRAEWNGRAFWLVDTGGLSEDPQAPMDAEIRRQVLLAVAEADMLLVVVDAQVGVHPSDAQVVDLVRHAGKPWLLVANKVDDPRSPAYYELHALGAGEPLPVSAVNGKGSGDLLDALTARMPAMPPESERGLRIAVVGRPNVGKSSFVNRLLGEQRLVVSEAAGTTRDAIDAPMTYHGRELVFVDTAGLRRQSRVERGIEFYAGLRTRRAIARADVALLLVDATVGLETQDIRVASTAWDNGCGLIIVVNKWDVAEKDDKASARFTRAAREKAPFLRWVPFLFASALTGQRVTRALELILEVDAQRQRRIPTAEVNEVLRALVARRQPPQRSGREIALRYATQAEVAPPTFAVFSNRPDLVEEHYVRYLHNGFREAWGFVGSPLRIVLRKRGD